MTNKINLQDLDWQPSGNDNFTASRKQLALHAGGKMIGASLYEVAPGNKAFPYHCHFANEEAILVINGEGTLRLNDEMISIKKDDYIALPCGREHAHQIINTSDQALTYLCISTMISPEVMEYPDSEKVGMMTGTAPGEKKQKDSQKSFYRKDSAVDYFDGES